jgi:hypothetical protein
MLLMALSTLKTTPRLTNRRRRSRSAMAPSITKLDHQPIESADHTQVPA